MTIITEKRCTGCNISKPLDEFYDFNRGKYGKFPRCKTCTRKQQNQHNNIPDVKARHLSIRREKYKNNPALSLFRNAKARARLNGYEFSITLNDIHVPFFCPYLGIRLESGSYKDRRDGRAPTLDRINPLKGYTPDNIEVISDLANRMKQNATIEQLVIFAKNILLRFDNNNPNYYQRDTI